MADITVRFAVKDAQVVRAALESVGKDGEAALQRVNRAFAQMGKSGGSAEQAAAAMAKARQEMEGVGRSGAGLDQAARGFTNVSRQAGLTRQQMLTVQYTVNDVIASLGSGMSPLTILLQQGGQVTQAFGGVAGTFRAAAAALGPFGLAAAGVATVLGGAVVAAESWRGELRAMALAARAGGDALGYTRDQLMDLGRATAAAANVSDAAGRQIVAGLARARIGGDALAAVAAQARDFAALTAQEVPQAAGALAKLFADPVKGAKELDASYGILTASQLRHIQTLAEQGRKTEAQIVLSDALGKRIRGMAEEELSIFARSWNAVGVAASNAWGAISRSVATGLPKTAEQIVEEARARVARAPDLSKVSADERRAIEAQNNPIFKGNNYAEDRVLDRQSAQMELLSALRLKDRQEVEALGRVISSVSQEDLKWLADTSAALDPVTAKRRILANEIERINSLLKDRSGLSADEEMEAANAKSMLENQLKGIRTTEEQARLDAKRAQALVGLTAAQRALKQAEFDTQDAVERGLKPSEEAGIAAANRAKALAGLSDASAATMRAVTQETASLLAQADAYGISAAAANKVQIAAQARAAVIAGQVTDERAYTQALLDQAAAQNLLASVQKTRDLGVQAESARRLAAAELQGAGAAREVTLALQDEADARDTLAKATDGTLARLLDELEIRKRLRREASDAEVTRKGRQTLTGQDGDIESLRLELALVGRLPAERTRELEVLRVKQQLLREGIDLNGEEGRKIIENARLIGDLRGQLEQQNKEAAAQQKIWDNAIEGIQGSFSDAFESILSGGTNTWKDLAGSLRSVMMKTIAEIATAMVFRPVIGGAMGAVGLGNVAQAAGLSSGGGASSGGIGDIFGKITGSIGNGTSAGGGVMGGLNSWLFGSAGSGNPLNPASYVPGSSGVLGSGGGLFGNSNLNIGAIGNVAGFGLSAFNFIQKPSLGSGLGMIGSGMGALSALGMIGPAFGPIGMGVSLVASLLGGLGQKTKHPGFGIEINNGTAGLELGKVSGKWMDTSGAKPMGQAAIDAINGVVKSMTGGSVGAGTGGQVYGLSYDGTVKKYRAVGEGLSESTQYDDVAAAISAVTVSALKNLPLTGVSENIATALKKSTADSLEGIKADIDFAKSWAESMSLLKSGLDPMKSQAAEISKSAKDAAASLQAWGVQFRDKSVALGQGSPEEVNAALRAMVDGALGLTKAAAPLQGYALAWEQAKANIAALKDTLTEFGFTAQETAAKLAAATEAARKQLADDQNSGLSAEILKLKDPKAADLAELEKWKAQAIAEAKAIGNQAGIALIEELFGLKQQAIVEQYKDRIDGLTEAQQRAADAVAQMTADLQSRALAVRQMDRAKALFDFDQNAAKQMASAPAGTEGSLSRVLAGERAMVEFQAYQRDLLEAYDRQIRDVQDQKSAIEAQISAIRAQTQALDGLRQSLEQFQQDLKLDPNLSILSTGQRRDEALSRMDALYAKGMGGDTEALRQWEPLARQFLAISREYNASTPGYVADYSRVQGQLDGALGKIRTPLQVAEAQLATLEAQSKQFDQQIDLLRSQREQAARLGERQLDSLDSLKAGTLEALARLQAAQADLAAGLGTLAGSLAAKAAGAANSNRPVIGSDGRPVGLLGGGLEVRGQDNTAYSEWSQEKKNAWLTLAGNLGINPDLYFRTGADFASVLPNIDNNWNATDGMGLKYVGASGRVYNTYAEWNAATGMASNQLGQWLTQQNTTFDEALRRAAETGAIIGGGTPKFQMGGVTGAYASGGIVANGLWNQDSVVARYPDGQGILVAGGEHITRATSVTPETLPVLDAINRSGRLPAVPVRPLPRSSSVGGGVDLAPLTAAVDRLGEKIDDLTDMVAASGDQTVDALGRVQAATGGVARELSRLRLVS